MAREWLLLSASVVVTLTIGVALLRWLAPDLLAGSPDLRIVRASEELPPFYEGVFRDRGEGEFIVNDPYTLVRARALIPSGEHENRGPTDLLGFRNRSVPNRVDVLVIGDSQTYGINVGLDENWPSRLQAGLRDPDTVVYSMAFGGWGAVQYLDMLEKGRAFAPRVAVIAFYSGNDAMESFRLAYGVDRWESLRVDESLTLDDRPRLKDWLSRGDWGTQLPSGPRLSFTPARRLYSNHRSPVVDAGWAIMAEAAQRMAVVARETEIALVFTIVPTKELAYAARLAAERVVAPQAYLDLIQIESARIAALAERLTALSGTTYVDLVAPLQAEVAEGRETHPRSVQGHPSALGYERIAARLRPAVEAALSEPREGRDRDHPRKHDPDGAPGQPYH